MSVIISAPDSVSASRIHTWLLDYFGNKGIRKQRYEGFWLNDYHNAVVAIKSDSTQPGNYTAYVIESRAHPSYKGLACFAFRYVKKESDETDYFDPEDRFRVYLTTHFRSDTVMTTGAYGKWRKLSNYSKPVLPLFAPYSDSARRSIIDQQTYLLVIPASDQKNIKLVDSLVRADSAILATTENLIIDIRNNLGGTTRTFDALLPYVYTHPIQDVDGLYFSTDRMIGQYQDYVDTLKKQKRDADQIPLLEDYIRLLKKNKGHFVAPPVVQDRKPIRLDSVRKYPRHVAIVANYACQSAAELMILKFRQSKKVTVFGETTMGVVDYLNFYSSRFPSKKYVLYIPSAKRTPPSGQGLLDGKGIQPDVTIPDQVPDWIGLVKAYYAKKKDIFLLKRNSKAVQE